MNEYNDLLDMPVYVDNESFMYEMAQVGSDRELKLRVYIEPDTKRVGDPYFKVYNSSKFTSETKVARIPFFKSEIVIHYKDSNSNWDLNNGDIKNIKKFLNKKHKDAKAYTNWQMTCWLWNFEYLRKIFDDDDRDDYMNGLLDERYKDNPSYVPSTTPMPDWEV